MKIKKMSSKQKIEVKEILDLLKRKIVSVIEAHNEIKRVMK
jgi:hypothetical protein